MLKITQADKHFISEYYIRKGYIVVWKDQRMCLTKRGSGITCDKIWVGHPIKVRDFIKSIDEFLSKIIK